MPTLTDRVKAAYKALRFPAMGGSSSESHGVQVFWPDWPAQCPAIPVGSPDVTSSSLIMAAVNWTGTQLGEPVPRVIEDRKDDWVPIDHALARLVERPNKYYSGSTMMKGFAYYWLVDGNVYWYKVRDKSGRVTELWLLYSEYCEPRWPYDGTEFISYYEYQIDGQLLELDVRDVIHFRYGIDPRNHRKGLAPLRSLMDEVLTDEYALTYSQGAMGSLGIPPFIISPKPNSDSVYTINAEQVKGEIIASTTGTRRGTPMVFSHPMDVQQIGFNPGQMAFDAIHRLPEERVSAVLGIPAIVLGYGAGLDRATYANYESALKAAWNGFVIPTLKVIASELSHQLLPDYSNPDSKSRWVEFDTSEIWALKEDEKSVAEREVMKWNAGLITRNEARAAMGLEPMTEGDTLNPGMQAAVNEVAPMPEAKQMGMGDLKPSAGEVEEIRAWWKANAPDEAKTLLDAEVVN